jgi:hypothetical protein
MGLYYITDDTHVLSSISADSNSNNLKFNFNGAMTQIQPNATTTCNSSKSDECSQPLNAGNQIEVTTLGLTPDNYTFYV